MSVCDHKKDDCACPFAFTDASEYVQGLGCLPTPFEIINMRIHHGKTWACHSDYSKPCVGAIRHLKERGMPYDVIDTVLIDEKSDWDMYSRPKIEAKKS